MEKLDTEELKKEGATPILDVSAEAASVLDTSTSPDADARPPSPPSPGGQAGDAGTVVKKRGRPKGSTNSKNKPKQNENEQLDPYIAAALFNQLYSSVCVLVLGNEAALEPDETKALNGALGNYLVAKDINAPPELILIGAYVAVTAGKLSKPTVSERVQGFFLRLKGRFYKPRKVKNENKEI